VKMINVEPLGGIDRTSTHHHARTRSYHSSSLRDTVSQRPLRPAHRRTIPTTSAPSILRYWLTARWCHKVSPSGLCSAFRGGAVPACPVLSA
jgi:hypothetical protein